MSIGWLPQVIGTRIQVAFYFTVKREVECVEHLDTTMEHELFIVIRGKEDLKERRIREKEDLLIHCYPLGTMLRCISGTLLKRAQADVGARGFVTSAQLKMPIASDYPSVPIPSTPFHEILLAALKDHVSSNNNIAFVDELKRHFDDCGPKVVLTNKHALSRVLNAARDTAIEKVICIRNKQTATFPSGVLCWHREVISTAIQTNTPNPKIDISKDMVFMPYSSGTTGVPKGVMSTHRNYGSMMNVYREQQRLYGTGALSPPWHKDRDKSFLLLPLYHCYGFALLMASLLDGNTSVLMSHFQPELFCETIQRHKIRFVAVAPPILVFLSKSSICANYDLTSLEFIMVGAAPTGRDLCEDLHRKYKNLKYIHQAYGMSEATMATHMPDIVNDQPFGSVGKIVCNLEMKIVDPETGAEQGRQKPGEVCIRGPTVMLGYHRNPQASEDTIKDGWLHTGDIGYVDDNGYLFIVDRLKELIKVKGFQVPPAELEGILLSHTEIHDAAVVGIPDGADGEVPKAYVVRADNSLTEEDVKNFINEKVSAYKQLAGGVEFLDTIPKSPAGKILRRLLRDHHKSKTAL